MLTYHGKTLCVVDWGSELGVPHKRITNRLLAGWSVDRALGTP
jgi:hypothetical protein